LFIFQTKNFIAQVIKTILQGMQRKKNSPAEKRTKHYSIQIILFT